MNRILVVDDEPAIRDAVGYALRTEGFDVDLVADGEDVHANAAETSLMLHLRPDLVDTDAIAAKLVDGVLDQLGGHPVLASAAYNAGPNRARRWRDARPLEGAIYAETIPYPETREYVKRVMANSVFYAALLQEKPIPIAT